MKLKKQIASLLATTLFFALLCLQPNNVYAEQKKIELTGGIIENGRTLIPMRSLFESLGAKVNWDAKTKVITATKEGISIRLTIDSTKVIVNDKIITLDLAPKIINSQTMVPVRFVSETLGAKVHWDSTTNIVIIDTTEQLITIKVEKTIPTLTKSEIGKIISTAEKNIFDRVIKHKDQLFKNELTKKMFNDSKIEMKKYYSEHFLNTNWESIIYDDYTHPWYVHYWGSSVINTDIISQTDTKIIIQYRLENDLDGIYEVKYTLVYENGNWVIDDYFFP